MSTSFQPVNNFMAYFTTAATSHRVNGTAVSATGIVINDAFRKNTADVLTEAIQGSPSKKITAEEKRARFYDKVTTIITMAVAENNWKKAVAATTLLSVLKETQHFDPIRDVSPGCGTHRYGHPSGPLSPQVNHAIAKSEASENMWCILRRDMLGRETAGKPDVLAMTA